MQVIIPQQFLEYAQHLLGEERFPLFSRALYDVPSVSVRLHREKVFGLSVNEIVGYDVTVPWATDGAYLKERPSFTADPLFHAGCYYVQEAASMFLEQVIRQYISEPVVALDLCAAPGGKSTHLRSLLPKGSFLVSNEPIRNRAQVLLENMIKWGHPDGVVTNSYPKEFKALHHVFDVIVTDVPCSGEGMFRKEEEAVSGWSMGNVMMCRERQREIVGDVWDALKPGGLLVYSTCTLNQYEDEENVRWIADELGAEVLPLEIPKEWNVLGALDGATEIPVYHLLQGFTRGEGFFLAVLRKNGGALCDQIEAKPKIKARQKEGGVVPKECRQWLRDAELYQFIVEGSYMHAIKKEFIPLVALLDTSVKIMHKGILLAMMKGRDWIPSHDLAMSIQLNKKAFPIYDVTYDEAIAYLRKEALILPTGAPKGMVLLTYKNVPLGFVKNVGSRANNLYPQEWKIRSSHLSPYSVVEVSSASAF